MDFRLLRQLERVARRFRLQRLLLDWSAIWLAAAVAAGLAWAAHRGIQWHWHYLPHTLAALAVLAALLGLLRLRRTRDYHAIAQRLERNFPELDARLLTAIEQPAAPIAGRLGYLQERVLHQTLAHAYRHNWMRAAPGWRLLTAHAVHLASLILFVTAVGLLSLLEAPPSPASQESSGLPAVAMAGDFRVTVEPGTTEIERGSSLLVLARFTGPLPPDATLVVQRGDDQEEQLPMSQSLEDPLFGGRIAEVQQPLTYQVRYADHETELFSVSVFEYPRLERADARLTFPEYTSLEDRLIQDVRTITAVEGTRVRLNCHLNKAVVKAELAAEDGRRLALQPVEGQPLQMAVDLVLDQSQRWKLHLVDEQGRANKQPPEFALNAVPNRPPDVKALQPSRDLAVSPLEELELKANAWDDFGLARIGLSWNLAGSSPQEVVLASAVEGRQRREAEHLVAFEELQAEPDQLMAYYFWAEDVGPDGSPRRVAGDMYFAEVRHFEEIFREGDPPPGNSPQMQGAGNQAQQLAELQKEIINATWKVIRREIGAQPTPGFAADLQVLTDSQTTVLEQAEEINSDLQDQSSLRHMLSARQEMMDALQHLSEAQTNSQPEALQPALAAEQRAYQNLLKLRAREHEVVRSQQASSRSPQGSGSNRAQQQLDQLELRENQQRYETETAAQQQQETRDRETRQVLNRLRELARRQNDLNERLKELQSALQEARSEREREEIRRQLQRLQEEQQQILRDLDELQDRMNQPENMERMLDQQQQLQEARENVRQASEALQEEQVSQAITSGTRAQREFEEVRDEFRRRSARRFEEEARQMREQAQQLDQRQEQLAEQVQQLAEGQARGTSLRDPQQPEDLEAGLQQQRQALEQLLEQMRQTVSEAEETEPLLAEQLYETARDAMQRDLDRALDSTARSLARGLPQDAQQQEQVARQGIQQLREGVEKAAERVLGDEAEALRQARAELQRLEEELKQELARANPQRQAERDADGQPQPGNPQADPDQPSRLSGDEQSRNQQDQPGQPQAGQEAGQQQAQQQQNQQQENQQQTGQQQEGQAQQQAGQQQAGQQQAGAQQGETPDAASDQPSDSPGGSPGRGTPESSRPRNPRRSLRSEAPSETTSQGSSGGPQEMTRDGGVENGASPVRGDQWREPAPLTGDDFRDWSDRLRDVEEMIDDPELRAEAARVRDRARGFRQELRRHSQEPQWDLVELQVLRPLAELRDRVSEELLRRSSREAVVPIDRDPVPPRYSEAVRRYYERLGSGSGSE